MVFLVKLEGGNLCGVYHYNLVGGHHYICYAFLATSGSTKYGRGAAKRKKEGTPDDYQPIVLGTAIHTINHFNAIIESICDSK